MLKRVDYLGFTPHHCHLTIIEHILSMLCQKPNASIVVPSNNAGRDVFTRRLPMLDGHAAYEGAAMFVGRRRHLRFSPAAASAATITALLPPCGHESSHDDYILIPYRRRQRRAQRPPSPALATAIANHFLHIAISTGRPLI